MDQAEHNVTAFSDVSVDRVRPGKTSGALANTYPYWKDKLAATQAAQGEMTWAIDLLESGDDIGPYMRAFLVATLRGEIKKPKGNKRTYANLSRDLCLLVNVVTLMCERQITENAAITLLVESEATSKKRHPLQLETARSMVKRAKVSAPDIRAINVNGKLVASWSAEAPPAPTVGEKLTSLLTKPFKD